MTPVLTHQDHIVTLVCDCVRRGVRYKQIAAGIEKAFITGLLHKYEGNQSRVAKLMGMHRNTLYRKIGEHQLHHLVKPDVVASVDRMAA